MKTNINKITGCLAVGALLLMSSCNDYLDITPPSEVTPETYFNTADQLGAYTISYYYYKNSNSTSSFDHNELTANRSSNPFPSFALGGSSYSNFLDDDQGTDNESGTNDRFFDGTSKVKVGSGGGSWSFSYINDINYFLEEVLPRYEANQIQGAEELIRHYIGEAYFLRANEYFTKLRSLGDFPTITTTLPLDHEVLRDSSERRPRNIVARFILADLDKAIGMLTNGEATSKNRITRDVALVMKARVALYEATFEKYFAGTPFVPDKNAGWPGANMSYNAGFTYDNASEVSFFLDQALSAAKEVCDRHPSLTRNNKQMIGSSFTGMPSNPYYDLFSTTDPSSMDEALMYRSYLADVGGGHCMNQYIRNGRGYTQEFANCFLMENGLPIYDAASGYKGDDYVADTKEGRDWRWKLFMKAPGEYIYEGDSDQRIGVAKDKNSTDYLVPVIYSGPSIGTSTGYTKGKGWSKDAAFSKGGQDYTAAVIFRSAEAYLIYLEAAWEKYGDGLDSYAWDIWAKLRNRAGLPDDPQVTIAATDLDKEEEYSHDFALYSGGKKISSKVLYNIRRERRCELISEGMRWDDLIRWRALDQLKTNRYYKHGAKIFGPMLNFFPKNKLKYDQKKSSSNNVSSPGDVEGGLNGNAEYWSLLRVSNESDWYESGYSWRMGHYLSPIAESHFLETERNGNPSTIYQNPYWSTEHDTPASE